VLTEAVRKGLTVRQPFFIASAATDIRTEHGAADAIVAANVVCHVADIHSLFAGVRRLLRPSGLFIFEDPHVGAILDQSAVDQIYDEHVFYFSLTSVCRVAEMHDLEVVDVSPQAVHGGELRYVLGLRGAHPQARSVAEWLDRERAAGVSSPGTYRQFATRAATIRDALTRLVARVVSDGHRIAGYRSHGQELHHHQLLRPWPRADRVHRRCDAGQAGLVDAGSSYPCPTARILSVALSGPRCPLRMEP
jgi:methylation protein EvaC